MLPRPLKSLLRPIHRSMLRRGWGDYLTRLKHEVVPRPNYGYCVYHGADLARRLGHDRISVLEFGVAGGNGLVALEDHAAEVEKIVGVKIEVYGFDTGQGLPPPEDYRDLPYHWRQGFFAMDRAALERRLRRARLVFGDIRETVGSFVEKHKPAPIAAVMQDMDYYSSTVAALSLFDVAPEAFLPRVFCYFDDVIGNEVELYNDYTGQRLAIDDFNRAKDHRKIARNYHLTTQENARNWHHQIFIYHDFQHRDYNTFISEPSQQLAINA